jgi:hypothetical protein
MYVAWPCIEAAKFLKPKSADGCTISLSGSLDDSTKHEAS